MNIKININEEDKLLALAALECVNGDTVQALRLLRSECGWTLRQGHHVLIVLSLALYYREGYRG